MAFTGFNPTIVKKSINSVRDAYEDLQDAIITVTQSQFVTPMTKLWCCKEAVQFFNNKFRPAMEGLNQGAHKTFNNVVEAMNSAASNWAKRTGNTGDWKPMSFNVRMKKLDVSGIKDKNAQGEIGIDEVQAVVKAGLLLTKTFIKAQAAVVKASSSVLLCGFLGGTQASSLQKSLKDIKQDIENTVKELVTSVKKAIEDSASSYHAVGGGVAQAFSFNGAGIGAAVGAVGGAVSSDAASTSSVGVGAVTAAQAGVISTYKPKVREEINKLQQSIKETEEKGLGASRTELRMLHAKQEALQEMVETGEIVKPVDPMLSNFMK